MPLTYGTLAVDLAVPVPSLRVGAERWRELSARLSQARVRQFNEIVRLLLSGGAATPFGDWPFELRHGAIATLESALLDATGTLRAQAHLPSFMELQRPGALRAYCAHLERRAPTVSAEFVELRGLVESFDGLLAVDWWLELDRLTTGDVNSVLLEARRRYRASPLASKPNSGDARHAC
jgi:hypothetical protein